MVLDFSEEIIISSMSVNFSKQHGATMKTASISRFNFSKYVICRNYIVALCMIVKCISDFSILYKLCFCFPRYVAKQFRVRDI